MSLSRTACCRTAFVVSGKGVVWRTRSDSDTVERITGDLCCAVPDPHHPSLSHSRMCFALEAVLRVYDRARMPL
eukprot:5833909-Pleurochrysis_carterae.AAC.2